MADPASRPPRPTPPAGGAAGGAAWSSGAASQGAAPLSALPAGVLPPAAAATAAAAALTPAAVPLPSGAAPPAAGGRPSVMQLVFREKGALYAAYMPLLADGGLFVPTPREYKLGEEIYLLLTLPDDPQRYPVAGRVAWITPANASGGRTQGVGVRFPADEKMRVLRLRIEEALGTQISSSKPTQTV